MTINSDYIKKDVFDLVNYPANKKYRRTWTGLTEMPSHLIYSIFQYLEALYLYIVHKNRTCEHRYTQFYNMMRIILCSLHEKKKTKIAFYTLIPYWWNSRELVFVSDFTAGNSRRQYRS